MTVGERAAQIWPVLAYAATNRQSLTYQLLGRLIGVPSHALGQLLEPIQSYCLKHGYAPLTVLVLGKDTGMPGVGFGAADEIPAAQAQVFQTNWLSIPVPDSAALAAAVRELPSR